MTQYKIEAMAEPEFDESHDGTEAGLAAEQAHMEKAERSLLTAHKIPQQNVRFIGWEVVGWEEAIWTIETDAATAQLMKDAGWLFPDEED